MQILRIFALCCLSVLASCVSGSGDSTSLTGGTGSVALMLKDAPSDDFVKIDITITKAELLAGLNGNVTLFSGATTVDLLHLANTPELFSLTPSIPAGTYEKIRLTVSAISLTKPDGTVIGPLPLPANGKIDLNPRGPFTVTDGQSLVIQLDVDAQKSIHIVGAGNSGYRFRPVVFVDVMPQSTALGLVYRHGKVANIDAARQTFDLCRLASDTAAEPVRCLPVAVGVNTRYFDNAANGSAFTGLSVDEEVTVIGTLAWSGQVFTLQAATVLEGARGTYDRLRGVAQTGVDGLNLFSLAVEEGQGYAPTTVLTAALQNGAKIFNRAGSELANAQIVTGSPLVAVGMLNTTPTPVYKTVAVVLAPRSAPLLYDGRIGTVTSAGFTLSGGTGSCVSLTSATVILLVTSDSTTVGAVANLPGAQVEVYGTRAVNTCLVADTVVVTG